MHPALFALIERYCETLAGQMQELDRLLSDFSGNAANGPVDVTEALDLSHRIAGIGGSMGYPDVSETAAALECALSAIEKAGGATGPGAVPEVAALLGKLQRAAGGATPEASALHSANLDWLDAPARTGEERV